MELLLLCCQQLLNDRVIWPCSALLNVGRKAEASEYLQKVVAYNPAYIKFLEDLETDSKDFASDLANSRKDF